MLLKSAVVLVMLLGCASSSLRASERLPYAEIGKAAQNYLDTLVSPKEVEKLKKNLMGAVETKRQDQGLTESEALSQIMLDWAFDNQSKIKSKERSAVVRASYYFTVFVDRGIPFPGVIEERLSLENARKIIDYLKEEVAKGKK